VLADAGLIDFREPFPRLASQGIVHAADGKRMCKSGGNVVTPDEVVERYGADVLRVYLLFMAPFDRNVNWNEDGIVGVERFVQRVFRLEQEDRQTREEVDRAAEDRLARETHKAVRRVTEDVEAFKFNTAVAAMMEFGNALNAHLETHGATPAFNDAIDATIRLLAPFAPHVTEELWARRGGAYSVHQQAWPTYDAVLATDETITLIVQVNGKVRDRIEVPAGIDKAEAERLALASEQVARYMNGHPPKKVIFVPGRLVNIVA
jgi:leucyl-tRNA synthetase